MASGRKGMATEDRSFWLSLTKTEWIAAARASLPRFRKPNTNVPGFNHAESCEVCGMSLELSEFHHVIPLEDQYERGFVRPAQYPSAWLCPNHHAMVHKFMRFQDFRKFVTLHLYSLTKPQADKIFELIEKARALHRCDGERSKS